MDIEPIYCAEQIVVPPDLAGVLKTFTKQVIRSQPDNVLEFAAKYFGDLAAQSFGLHAVAATSKRQLWQAYQQLKQTPTVPMADISMACHAAGISEDTLQRVVAAGRIDTSKAVSVLEVLLLLLTMGCETFAQTVQGMFDVFGSSCDSSSRMNATDFVGLLALLAAYDSDISSHMQQQVSDALNGQLEIDYKDLLSIPVLKGKLTLM